MITRRKGAVAALCMVATLAVAQPAHAYTNLGYLPHHQWQTYTANGCTFSVKHGNYWGAAYSDVHTDDADCTELNVQTVAILNGQLTNSSVDWTTYEVRDAHTQVTNGTVVGTRIWLCQTPNPDGCIELRLVAVR
jgi:hypothetical protein